MIKILHSADWHLDSPLQGRTPEQTRLLREKLLDIPRKVSEICKAENCDMMLLSGDLLDGSYTKDSYLALRQMLEEVNIPVFIAPGNHDYVTPGSPWLTETWPENVFIFTDPHLISVAVSHPKCWVFGAGFTSMDAPAMLDGFHAEDADAPLIGILHGDPTQVRSPYNAITKKQVQDSGLDYLALGHIHKSGSFQEGKTLCAWPGCPMGRGYDEEGQKGVLIVSVDDKTSVRFVPLDSPKFYDWEITVSGNAEADLAAVLPPVGNEDFYRITFTGASQPIDLQALIATFSRFPNLELRDRTTPPVDIWSAVGEDSFEGMYFKLLQDSLENQDEKAQERITLAAEISRKLLDGQEVVLP